MTFSPLHLKNTILLLGVLLLIAAWSAADASARVLWTADGERARTSEWASYSCEEEERVRKVGGAAQGSYAYEFEVQDGDDEWGERCELGNGNPGKPGFPLHHEGDDHWISYQVYMPEDYPLEQKDWQVFFQIHQPGDGGCPPIAMHFRGGKMVLENSSAPTYVLRTDRKWDMAVPKGRWLKLTMHIKFSGRDDVGFVELYGDFDGQGMKQVMERKYMHTMSVYENGESMVEHSRIGIYRSKAIPGPTTLKFDGFTIATDRESAEANAFGQPGPAPSGADAGAGSGDAGAGSGDSGAGTGTGRGAGARPDSDDTTQRRSTRSRTKKRRARVWLRSERNLLRGAGFQWPRVVPVYGGVRGAHGRRRPVVIQIRRNGRWKTLDRGRLRRNGRFYILAQVEPGIDGVIKLRARVPGLGHSRVLRTTI